MAYLRGSKLLPLVNLSLLVLEMLDFSEHATLLGMVGVGSLRRLLLRELGGFILRREFERADVSWTSVQDQQLTHPLMRSISFDRAFAS